MSNSHDQTANRLESPADMPPQNSDPENNRPATEDLNSILRLISAQLEAADRRQTEVLEQLERRLQDLSTETRTRKSRVPAAYVPAFERIQQGIAQLIEKISEDRDGALTEEAGQAEAAANARATANETAEASAAEMPPAGELPSLSSIKPNVALDQEANTQDALASAGFGLVQERSEDAPAGSQVEDGSPDDWARDDAASEAGLTEVDDLNGLHQPARVSQAPVDTSADVISSINEAPGQAHEASAAPDVEDPWDAQSAEALALSYESSEAEIAAATAEQPMGLTTTTDVPLVFANSGMEDIQDAAGSTHAEASHQQPQQTAAVSQPDMLVGASSLALAAFAPVDSDPLAFEPPTQHPAPEFSREWLEERFSQIADRIEHALAEMRPDDELFQLGDRFERMQERITQALADLPTRADLDSLKADELPIEELLAQIERTDGELARIGTLEEKLSEMMAELTTGRFAELADRLETHSASGQPAAEPVDIEAVAEAAASRVAAQFQAMAANGGESPAIDELRALIEGMRAEQQSEQSNTASALETIQQAMINVLDRVEAMESSPHATQLAAPNAFASHAQQGDLPDEDFGHEYADPHGRNGSDDTTRSENARHEEPEFDDASTVIVTREDTDGELHLDRGGFGEAVPAREAASREAASARSFATAPGEVYVKQPSTEDDSISGDYEPHPDVTGMIAPDLPSSNPVDRLRRDFIEDAKRARQRASAEADAAMAASVAKGQAIKPGKVRNVLPDETDEPKSKSLLSSLLGRKTASHTEDLSTQPPPSVYADSQLADAAQSSTLFGIRRNTLLIGAAVTFVTVAAVLMLIRKDTPPPAMPVEGGPAIEQSTGGSAAPAATEDFADPFAGEASDDNAADDLFGDDPGDRGEVIDGPVDTPNRRTASLPEGYVPGVAVQQSRRTYSENELSILRERQDQAELSAELGRAAASATPASLLPELSAEQAAKPAASLVRSGMASAMSLPPASVGPLSLRLAAAKGHPSAQFEVGVRLAGGLGTQQDFKAAIEWFKRAAQQDFAQAQYRLGTLYERGLGVRKDPIAAKSYYLKAAANGNVKAMHNLAVLSAGSHSGSPDYATAAQWFAKAAAYGLGDSQYNLAVLYESGLGVSQSNDAAYQFFTLAARSGDTDAAKRREALRAKLDADRIAKADRWIANWRRKGSEKIANDPRAAGELWKETMGDGLSS